MQTRRTFLRSAGAVAAISSVPAVSADSGNSAPSLKRIHEAFHSGAVEDGVRGVEAELEDLGIEPNVTESQEFDAPDGEDFESGMEISPDYMYGDPLSSDSRLIVHSTLSGDEATVNVHMSLRDPTRVGRNAWWADDVIGIGFATQDWAPIGTPEVSVTDEHTARFTAENVADDALAGTIDITNNEFLGAASSDSLPDYSRASLSGKFRLRSGFNAEKSSLWGSYVHTYAWEPTGSITGISGGFGGVAVDTNWRASKAWSIAHPTDPEPFRL